MRMRSDVIVPTGVVAVVFLFLIAAAIESGAPAPAVPKNVFHDDVITAAGCLTCHTPGKQAPLSRTHTSATECLGCHRFR